MADLFISRAWATSAPPEASFISFVPLIILFVAFWFFLIRPQMKRAKEHRAMLADLDKGDEVVTNGGLLGKIREIGDNFVLLDLGQQVQVKVQKHAISNVMPKGTIKTL